eukprot:TRINITY_DN30037_c0_g1_i2.p1 TRINITY_DN30037_c0_g1~~TRINITY_DN30037_c0_g1_i2.p1  ORF type:complete len:213 (+),score=18.51 TRINITY_DN30037_c0_g1_i2:51-689(+)
MKVITRNHLLRSRASRGCSHVLSKLCEPEVRIVHVPRPQEPLIVQQATQLLSSTQDFRVLDSSCSSGQLAADSPILWALDSYPELAERVARDVLEVAAEFSSVWGRKQLCIKLQGMHSTACPRFHVDKVTARALRTYVGAGTEFLAPEDALVWDERVLRVNEANTRRASAFDWLYLKGSQDCWLQPAAVHRSPPFISDDASIPGRLLLSIDF